MLMLAAAVGAWYVFIRIEDEAYGQTLWDKWRGTYKS